MAEVDKTVEGVANFGVGERELVKGKVGGGFVLCTDATTGYNFVALFLEQNDAAGTITSSYIWPNSSGVLRRHTSKPTAQDSDGSAV